MPITYETEALFCFHHINAYEEAGHVVVDLIVYTDPYSVLDEFYLKNVHLGVLPGAKSESRRYVLPLDIDVREPVKRDPVGKSKNRTKTRIID